MNEPVKLTVSTEFSDTPGARSPDEGPDSGQVFYETLLRPKFQKAVSSGVQLHVDMDGTFGFATSFLSESFGRLSREFGKDTVISHLTIKSDEDSWVSRYSFATIRNPEAQNPLDS